MGLQQLGAVPPFEEAFWPAVWPDPSGVQICGQYTLSASATHFQSGDPTV